MSGSEHGRNIAAAASPRHGRRVVTAAPAFDITMYILYTLLFQFLFFFISYPFDLLFILFLLYIPIVLFSPAQQPRENYAHVRHRIYRK